MRRRLARNSEYKPSNDLNGTRLEAVWRPARDPECEWIVEVHIRQQKTASVEGVEHVRAKFKGDPFGQPRLFRYREILVEKWPATKIVVGRRRVAEEAQRVGVISRVRRRPDVGRAE